MPRNALVAALFMAVALSGCFGDGSTDTHEDAMKEDTDETIESSKAPKGMHNLTYDTEPFHAEVWENGTSTYQEALQCWIGTCADVAERMDLTTMVPEGVPVWIQVVVEVEDSFWIWLEGDDYHQTFENTEWEGDDILFQVMVRRASGGLDLVYSPMTMPSDDASDVPYTLRVSTTHEPDVVPPHMPTALHLGPNHTLQAEPSREDFTFFLYGPDHRFIGSFENTAATLPADAAEGDYIVLVEGGQVEGIRLWTDAGGSTMKSLAYRYETTVRYRVPENGDASWTIDVSEVPAGASINSYSGETPAGPRFAGSATAYEVTLDGPPELHLEYSHCPGCFGTGIGGGAESLYDTPLDPGTYTLTASADATYNVEVWASFRYFEE